MLFDLLALLVCLSGQFCFCFCDPSLALVLSFTDGSRVLSALCLITLFVLRPPFFLSMVLFLFGLFFSSSFASEKDTPCQQALGFVFVVEYCLCVSCVCVCVLCVCVCVCLRLVFFLFDVQSGWLFCFCVQLVPTHHQCVYVHQQFKTTLVVARWTQC